MSTETAVRERPILFSGPMVRAILAGRKTQTRRVVKPQPVRGSLVDGWNPNGTMRFRDDAWHWDPSSRDHHAWHDREDQNVGDWAKWFHAMCPYGKVGERMWVRETWGECPTDCVGSEVVYAADYEDGSDREAGMKYRPSIHMPRSASRINLEITGVSIERLQTLSAADAWAEGVRPQGVAEHPGDGTWDQVADPAGATLDEFQRLWATIHKADGPNGWDANPWVWAITFKVI